MEDDYQEITDRKYELIKETEEIVPDSQEKLFEYYHAVQQQNRESTSKQ